MKTALAKIIPLITCLSLVCALFFPHVSLAQTPAASTDSMTGANFVPLTQLPAIQSAASADTLPVFLNQLYKISIGIGTVLAFFMIIRAGIEIMISRGSVASNEKAKNHLQGAVLGLVLLLSPYVVFSIINPDILNLSLDFGSLGIKNPPASAPQDPGPAGQSQQQCGTIVKKQSVELKKGVDQPSQCTVLGKGWAKYNSSCCSITDSNYLCCGYDPKNEQVPANPASGKYTFTGYFKTKDESGDCLFRDFRTYTTQRDCSTALTKWQSDSKTRSYTFAIANNCDASGNLQVAPQSTWNQISRLPSCQL